MYKLGKNQVAPRNRARLLQFADYAEESKLPPIPKSYDASLGKVSSWGMDGNDTCGDCTVAAAEHWIRSATAANNDPWTGSTDQCIDQYSALGGYKRGVDSTDNGLDPTVVLNAWRQTGLFGFVASRGFWPFKKTVTLRPPHKIGAYVSIPTNRQDLIEAAIYLFGGIYFGIELPTNWNNVGGVNSWAVNPTITTGPYAPDPSLGHMLTASKYDEDGTIYPVSWGDRVPMAPGYRNLVADCIFAVISTDYIDPKSGKSPAGFDFNGLNEDLALVTR